MFERRPKSEPREKRTGDFRVPPNLPPAGRTTVQTPFARSEDHAWKDDYWKVMQSPEQMAKAKAEFDRQKDIAKQKRERELGEAAGGS